MTCQRFQGTYSLIFTTRASFQRISFPWLTAFIQGFYFLAVELTEYRHRNFLPHHKLLFSVSCRTSMSSCCVFLCLTFGFLLFSPWNNSYTMSVVHEKFFQEMKSHLIRLEKYFVCH
ncbi:hypothetical protein FB451DRAFT_605295 [Mycena latifolia]|nr:hypothetical protein FB451DRAFT_605295 [Mycena latifolia]